MSRRSRRKSSGRKSTGSRFLRWVGFGGVAFLLLAIVALVLGYRAVRAYLRSDDFRVLLEEKTGDSLDGEAHFQPFEWEGWSFKTDEFRFTGSEEVTGLTVSNIEAGIDIAAIWDGVYRVESVSLRRVEVIADLRDREGRAEASPEIEENSDSARRGGGGFFDRFIPRRVELTGVDVGQIRGTVQTEKGDWSIENISAALRPGSGEDVYDLSLSGGVINTPVSLVEELALRELEGRYSNERFYLLSSNFDLFTRGSLRVSGEYDLGLKVWNAQGTMTGVRAEELVSEDWKQRLMGAVKTDFTLRGGGDKEVVISGSLDLEQGTLTALPILDRIAAYTNAVRFRHLALSDARLDFRKEDDRLEFTNIELASEGLVRIEGRLVLIGEVIHEGIFRVGITPGTLSHIPGAETAVFERGDLGLLWAPMRVTGTLDDPKEDLSDRLIEAAGLRMFEMIPSSGEWVLKNTNKVVGQSTRDLLAENGIILEVTNSLLDRGNEAVKDVTDKVLEEGAKAAEDAVESLLDIFGKPSK